MTRLILHSPVLLAALLVIQPSIAGEIPSLPEITGGDFEQLAQGGSGGGGRKGGQRNKKAGQGDGGGRNPSAVLKKLDEDGDGRISKAEFRGPPQEFGKIDANEDGYLTKEELNAHFSSSGGGEKSNNPYAAWNAKLPIINTHAHFDPRVRQGRDRSNDWDTPTKVALEEMDRYGVKTAFLMHPPLPSSRDQFYDYRDLLDVAKEHPVRFAVLGGGANLNPMINGLGVDSVSEGVRRDFEEEAENILKKGAIGFGEMTALHLSGEDTHPFVETPPDHPLFLLLADIAARHEVPFDIHMEAMIKKSPTPEKWKQKSKNNPDYLVL